MQRSIRWWSLVVLVWLAACSPIVAPTPAAPTPAAPLPAETGQTDLYTDPEGRFTVPIPTNWTAATADGLAVLRSPQGLIEIFIAAYEDVAPEAAVAQAWAAAEPGFDLALKETRPVPPRTGSEEAWVYDYAAPAEQVVQALVEEREPWVYVTLIRGDLAELGRRGAQLNIVLTGFTPAGVEEVNLAGIVPPRLSAAELDELAAYITDALPRFDVPGAAVAVVQGDEVILLEGFGVRDQGGTAPITPQTRMMIGSTGKTMTTMLLARLVDEGLLDWDTPVQSILPQFAVADPALSATITVRNLVCACTGVPRRDLEFIFNADTLTAEAVIESLRTFEFFTDFGEAFQYSNQLVGTAGWVAAAAAGGRYGSLDAAYFAAMSDRIFTPIGMDATTYSFDEVLASDNYALPHGLTATGTRAPLSVDSERILLPVAPAGAVWSTAADMARYLQTELNQGVAPDGTTVVSARNLAVTWEPQVPVGADVSYGLGWFVDEYKGQPLLHHGGNTLGFTADLAFLPAAELGIVVIANGQVANMFTEAVRFRLFELAFDLPHEYDAGATMTDAEIRRQSAELVDAQPVDPAAVTPYLGRYTNPALGDVELRMADGVLTLDIGELVMEVRAMPAEADAAAGYVVYTGPLLGSPVELATDADGRPTLTFGAGAAQYTFTPVE